MEMDGWDKVLSKSFDGYSVPNLELFEISKKRYTIQKKLKIINNGKLTGAFDTETWKDFTKPNMFSFAFTWVKRGEPEITINGHFKNCNDEWKLNDRVIWKSDSVGVKYNCECGCKGFYSKDKAGKMKVGTERKRFRKGGKIMMLIGYLWAEDMKSLFGSILNMVYKMAYSGQGKICSRDSVMKLFAHNAGVDYISLCESMGLANGEHPFTMLASESSEKSEIKYIARGSGILCVKVHMDDFLPDGFTRRYFDTDEDDKTVIVEDGSYPIEIIDSYALLPVPLSVIASAVGFPKNDTPEIFWNGNHEHFGDRTKIKEEDITYAVNDSVALIFGVSTMLKMLQQFGYSREKVPYTVASGGYAIISSEYAKNKGKDDPDLFVKKSPKSQTYMANVNNQHLNSITRFALVGGSTRVFNPHLQGEGNFGAIDGRAFYPSAFVAKYILWKKGRFEPHLPDFTKLESTDSLDLEKMMKSNKEGVVHINWIRPDTDIGIIASRNDDDLLDWNCESGTRWITLLQARWATERGYDLTLQPISETVAIDDDSQPIIKEITAILCPRLSTAARKVLYQPIKKAYSKRAEMRAAGDGMQEIVKICLNSFSFGKFCEIRKESLIVDVGFWETDMTGAFNDDDWTLSVIKQHNPDKKTYGYAKKNVVEAPPNNANILACYITDIARISLTAIGDYLGQDSLVYQDTDSHRFSIPHADPDGMKVVESLYGTELCQWDYEFTANYFNAVAPKSYKYRDADSGKVVMKMKGVNTKSMVAREWSLLSIAERAAYGFIGVNGEVGYPTEEYVNKVLWETDLHDEMIYSRPRGLKESFRNGKTQGEWHDVKKKLARK